MEWINSRTEQFMQTYLDNHSPTSYEYTGQKLWMDYIAEYVDKLETDNYGTAFAILNPGKDYRVMIEAHADEISWYISYINDDGFCHVMRNGGSDQALAPSKRVFIHTRTGIREGVFGWPAIHTRKDPHEPVPKVEELFIDVGAANKQEVLDMGIHVGCVVTYQDTFTRLNNRFYVGRALDNRIGGVMIAEVARHLREQNIELPYSLYIVNSVMEEVGLRGAEMIVETIRPHAAIITDVTHDSSTPLIEKKKFGDIRCGLGPSVTFGPAVHNKLQDLVIDTAQQHGLPLQYEAASRSTGTDTDAIAFACGGVPSALISLPLRYMHTTVEMVDKIDVANTIALMFHTLQNIKHGHSFKYL